MALCALASLVDAIIFIDYLTVQPPLLLLLGAQTTHTFVIFSMFRTDFNRNSISRRVAMLRAPAGVAEAPAAAGTRAAAARTMVWRESIV